MAPFGWTCGVRSRPSGIRGKRILMKISGPRGPASGAPVAYGGRVGRSGAPTEAKAGGAVGSVRDTTSILGIPETEFTPKVRDAILHLLREVESLRAELEQSRNRIAHLEKLADQDALVPVANRRAFVRELSRMLAFAQRYGGQVSVLYFDIDDMKRINDTHGHAAGDAAIAHVARTLLDHVRESDVVGRLGGDELGVILAKASEAEATLKAESLASLISGTPLEWQGQQIDVRVSFGAYALKGAEDAAAMLHQADRAMYAAKPGASRTPGSDGR